MRSRGATRSPSGRSLECARRIAQGHDRSRVRHKEIVYSSRTRAATDRYKYIQKLRIALARLLEKIPEELRDGDDAKLLLGEADDKVCNIAHLIYRARPYEGIAKDFEFSRRTMEEHWKTGYDNARQTLAHPEVLQLPDQRRRAYVRLRRGPA